MLLKHTNLNLFKSKNTSVCHLYRDTAATVCIAGRRRFGANIEKRRSSPHFAAADLIAALRCPRPPWGLVLRRREKPQNSPNPQQSASSTRTSTTMARSPTVYALCKAPSCGCNTRFCLIVSARRRCATAVPRRAGPPPHSRGWPSESGPSGHCANRGSSPGGSARSTD